MHRQPTTPVAGFNTVRRLAVVGIGTLAAVVITLIAIVAGQVVWGSGYLHRQGIRSNVRVLAWAVMMSKGDREMPYPYVVLATNAEGVHIRSPDAGTNRTLDPWGKEYCYAETDGGFEISSDGPDRRRCTSDDIKFGYKWPNRVDWARILAGENEMALVDTYKEWESWSRRTNRCCRLD
jgi:hypothetical protein